MISRPLYVPHVGQTTWGRLTALHCGQVLTAGWASFLWVRRLSLRHLEPLRFGFGMAAGPFVYPFGFLFIALALPPPGERGPARIDRALLAPARLGVPIRPALRAEPATVGPAEQPARDRELDLLAHQRLGVELVGAEVDDPELVLAELPLLARLSAWRRLDHEQRPRPVRRDLMWPQRSQARTCA